MSSPHRVGMTLSEDLYREAWIRAEYKGLSGPSAVSNCIKVAAFDLFKKYRVPEAERARLEKRYREEVEGLRAVQPEGFQGDSGGDAA